MAMCVCVVYPTAINGKKHYDLKGPRERYMGNFGVKNGKEEHNYSIISK